MDSLTNKISDILTNFETKISDAQTELFSANTKDKLDSLDNLISLFIDVIEEKKNEVSKKEKELSSENREFFGTKFEELKSEFKSLSKKIDQKRIVLFGDIEESSEGPEFPDDLPSYTNTAAKNVDQMLGLLKNLKSDSSKIEIAMQLMGAIDYIERNREEIVAKAKENGGTLYMRPEEYLSDEGGKVDKFRKGDVEKAKYFGCHLQVNVDEAGKTEIYLIPKHPDLYLGTGALKRVRTGIKYGGESVPSKLIACASFGARGYKIDVLKDALREVELINEALGGKEKIHITYFEREGAMPKAKIFMPYANKGDLSAYIAKGGLANDLKGLSPKEQKEFKMDLSIGLTETLIDFHNTGLIHGDIKLQNVLLHASDEGKFVFYILDLGSTYRVGEPRIMEGTIASTSPELYSVKTANGYQVQADGKKGDVFSAGIALNQLVKNNRIPSVITKSWGIYEPEIRYINNLNYIDKWSAKDIKNDFDVLIHMMLHPQPSKRPSFDEVLLALTKLKNKDEEYESEGVLNDWKVKIEEDQEKMQEYLDTYFPEDEEDSPFYVYDDKEFEEVYEMLIVEKNFTYLLRQKEGDILTGKLIFFDERLKEGKHEIDVDDLPLGTEEDMRSNLHSHTFKENDFYVQYSLEEKKFKAYQKEKSSDGTVSYIIHDLTEL